jgi:predicted cobalt transporter CbtA
MLSGVLAGVLALAFATAFGEPPIERAIAFESLTAAQAEEVQHPTGDASGAHEETAPVSREVQRTAGLAVGLLGLGVAFGGIFAVAYAFARGRLGTLSDRATALTVAILAFGALYLAPSLKYPANPPATSLEESMTARTTAYVGMLVISILITIGAVMLQRRAARGLGGWDATLVAAAAGGVALAGAALLMPSFVEVPAGFPADALWRFRVASVGTQLVLWLGIGLAFGLLTERAARAAR